MDEDKRNSKVLSRKTSVTLETRGRPECDRCTGDVLDSPAASNVKPSCSTGSNQRSRLLKIGDELPLIIPPKMGGYWLDPPLEKLIDMSPCTSPPHGPDIACYEVMERDSDAKIYREFFGSRRLCENVTVSQFEVVSYLKITEEDILSNTEESEEFQDFLSILGETVQLQGFTGFRGGLDVSHGQTGDHAVVTSFQGRQVMFHVATKLPFTEADPQQEGKTPFISDVISSHFLHCFLVVRRVRGEEDQKAKGEYQSSLLRQFLLTKLINAEISCYKAERFSRLELRTRSSLLEGLQKELSARSESMLRESSSTALPSCEGLRGVSEGNEYLIHLKMSSKKVVELFFDVVSPYTWLAFEDLDRLAQYFEVPLKPPSNPFEAMFEKGSLSAMRFVAAVQEQQGKLGDKQVELVSRELWRRIWSQDKDITTPESLSEAAMKAGISASEVGELLRLSSTKEIKDKLKNTTKEALNHGAFGFPLIVCHVDGKPEIFFGSDRFELMAHCIGEKWLGPQPEQSAAKL
ncbi:hypothetical protein NHX12_001533 [Muraenolepis orangiensis]|uniref:Glutathione S-transferase kappa 1 n=1 Tax=Muraenolepis orangiensis TaxID=630683 RepID=A0A9Q0E0W4_9TELE|nr:hypothetical protein NHX12_001533 [Muraenolepis orangiensis]